MEVKGQRKKLSRATGTAGHPMGAKESKQNEDDQGTKKEDENLDTEERDSLEKDLVGIMDIEMGKNHQVVDMTVTDNDGDIDEYKAAGITNTKEKDRASRRQRSQEAEANGKGSQERSRSRS